MKTGIVIILIIATIAASQLVRAMYAGLRKRFGKAQAGAAQESWQQPSDPLASEEVRQPPPDNAFSKTSDSVTQRFRSSLRAATDSGKAFDNAFNAAMRDTSDALQTEDGLREAAQMKYPAETVAAFMATKKFPLAKIALFVDDHYDPDFETILSILTPLAAGETPEAKAQELSSP